jgi:Spy/CpxP family protein refolding chaperone
MTMNSFLLSLAAAMAVALSVSGCASTSVASSGASPAAATYGGPGGASRGGRRFGQMLLSLNLSDAQKTQIRTIMDNARAQSKTLTDPQAKRATMRAAFAQVQTVLTPGQQSKLKSEMQAARAQYGGAAHS